MDRRPSIHGTRLCYQRGCRCRQCRQSEASYRQALRVLKAKGHRPGGALIHATLVRLCLRRLFAEGFTKAAIARRLGLKMPALRVNTRFVRASTEQKLSALVYTAIEEGADGPDTPLNL
jgi:hypothetical protein